MLRKALFFNVIFSLSSAIVILLAKNWLTKSIPLPEWLWLVLGFGLLGFVVLLISMLNNENLLKKNIVLVIISDVVWIALTSLALIIYIGQISVNGMLLVILVNLTVAALAYCQFLGYKLTAVGSS